MTSSSARSRPERSSTASSSVAAVTGRPAAVHHICAVFEVVDEATTGRLMDHVRDELPAGFHRVIDAGSQGRMSRDD